MSWTYSSALATDRDRVRFLLQDIDSARQLVADEEITWMLTQEQNVYTTAAAIADSLAAKSRGVASKSVGDFSLSFTKEYWDGLAIRLRKRGAGYQQPTAQGLSISEKDALTDDTDAVQPVFTRTMQENKGS